MYSRCWTGLSKLLLTTTGRLTSIECPVSRTMENFSYIFRILKYEYVVPYYATAGVLKPFLVLTPTFFGWLRGRREICDD